MRTRACGSKSNGPLGKTSWSLISGFAVSISGGRLRASTGGKLRAPCNQFLQPSVRGSSETRVGSCVEACASGSSARNPAISIPQRSPRFGPIIRSINRCPRWTPSPPTPALATPFQFVRTIASVPRPFRWNRLTLLQLSWYTPPFRTSPLANQKLGHKARWWWFGPFAELSTPFEIHCPFKLIEMTNQSEFQMRTKKKG